MSDDRSDGAPTVRLALAQMRVEPGAAEANVARAVNLVRQAAASGSDIVLFPETLDFGWTWSGANADRAPLPDSAAYQALARAAADSGVYVRAGLTETAGNLTFNSAVLIGPDGRQRLRHRKIHELPFARTVYAEGSALRVVDTPFGRVGILICSDALAPGHALLESLGLMGARLVLSPCAWADEPGRDLARTPYGDLWRDVYRPVSARYALPIAAVSNVGPVAGDHWATRRCIGNSIVFDAGGREVLTGPYGDAAEALLRVDLRLPARRERA